MAARGPHIGTPGQFELEPRGGVVRWYGSLMTEAWWCSKVAGQLRSRTVASLFHVRLELNQFRRN